MGSIGEQIAAGARGQYLITALIDCGGCHTADPTKPFAGGVRFAIDASGHYVTSRNLTPDPDTGSSSPRNSSSARSRPAKTSAMPDSRCS